MDQTDFPGDTIEYINFAPFLIGTPVIDSYKFELTASGVHYADQGPKGEVGMCGSQCFAVEGLTIRGLTTVKPRSVPAGITYPGLNRLPWLIQMRNEGGLHRWSDEEHKRNPPKCSPDHEESMSHSLFFVLRKSRKV